jgi:hypothetical protein
VWCAQEVRGFGDSAKNADGYRYAVANGEINLINNKGTGAHQVHGRHVPRGRMGDMRSHPPLEEEGRGRRCEDLPGPCWRQPPFFLGTGMEGTEERRSGPLPWKVERRRGKWNRRK